MFTRPARELIASSATTGWAVFLLGLPLVAKTGNHADIPRREVRALLFVLAAHLEPMSREQLCFLFWPHMPECSARRALSHLLTHLRRALDSNVAVLTWDDQIELDPEHVWSDAVAFERLITGTGGPRNVDALKQATELYRGPFLSGFSLNTSEEFEVWVLQERQIWERLCLEALAVLIEEHTMCHEYSAAIKYAQRYLDTDDLAEDVHRRLIELYIALGDRTAAIRQFENCAAVLGRELGVNPQPMTWAAYQVALGTLPLTLPPR